MTRYSIPFQFSNYILSDQGYIYSFNTGLVVPVFLDHSGYRSVYLVNDKGQFRKKRIYQIVAYHWLGPKPRYAHTRHLNDNKMDDRLANLSYGTVAENTKDYRRNKLGKGKQRDVGYTPIYDRSVTISTMQHLTDCTYEEWRLLQSQ